MMNRHDEIASRLEAVHRRIERAAMAVGRNPADVTLLPVTKYHPAADVEILHDLGISAVGENRDQEAREKSDACPYMDFHMIGQIQSKKTTSIARWAACVHSVDSVAIARRLNSGVRRALAHGERRGPAVIPCFVQVSADGDPHRGGASRETVDAIVETMMDAEHLRFSGVMCVPPLGSDAREVFDRASRLVDALADRVGYGLEFSAGMTADLDDAIAAGSTLVRVGTDILGPRQIP